MNPTDLVQNILKTESPSSPEKLQPVGPDLPTPNNNATVPLRFKNEAGMVANAGVPPPHEGAGHAGIQTRGSRNGGGCGDHVCSHRNR
jgi:hypothetical protein